METQDAALLRAFPLFAELPDAVIKALSAMAITREYPAGTIVQLEGDPATSPHPARTLILCRCWMAARTPLQYSR